MVCQSGHIPPRPLHGSLLPRTKISDLPVAHKAPSLPSPLLLPLPSCTLLQPHSLLAAPHNPSGAHSAWSMLPQTSPRPPFPSLDVCSKVASRKAFPKAVPLHPALVVWAFTAHSAATEHQPCKAESASPSPPVPQQLAPSLPQSSLAWEGLLNE